MVKYLKWIISTANTDLDMYDFNENFILTQSLKKPTYI